MDFESPYRRIRLAPRCRLIISWKRRNFQGFDCSSMKMVRELGLERCETVRSLSSVIKNINKIVSYERTIVTGFRFNVYCE